MKKVGIDSISYYVPSLYVDIEELAKKRDIPAEKLVQGLGLKKMATPDYDEDSASIAANSLFRLISENNINPCLLYTSPSPRDKRQSRMPSSA